MFYAALPPSPVAPLPNDFTYDDCDEEYNKMNNNNNNNNGGSGEDYNYDREYNMEDPKISGSLVADSTNPYAPEVNKWTTLMAERTNIAIHRPGKETTLEEGMEILCCMTPWRIST